MGADKVNRSMARTVFSNFDSSGSHGFASKRPLRSKFGGATPDATAPIDRWTGPQTCFQRAPAK